MWMLLLGLLAGATDPVCERNAWRRQSARQVEDETHAEAIDALLRSQSSGSKVCPQRVYPESCMADGRTQALAGVMAFEALSKAVDEAQQYKDVGSLLTERHLATMARRAASQGAVRTNSGGWSDTDAEAALEQIPGQLVLRTQADARVAAAEGVWMDAARAWNGARCACDAVCVPPPASMDRQLTRLKALREALVEAQQSLLDRFSLDTLEAKLEHGGAADVGEGLLRARITRLQTALAEHGARPHAARLRLTSVIASLDGHNLRGTDAQSALVAWLMYDRAWRRHYRKLDTHIDRIVGAWARVDAAETGPARDIANGRLERAFRLLREGCPGTPSTLRVR